MGALESLKLREVAEGVPDDRLQAIIDDCWMLLMGLKYGSPEYFPLGEDGSIKLPSSPWYENWVVRAAAAVCAKRGAEGAKSYSAGGGGPSIQYDTAHDVPEAIRNEIPAPARAR